MCQISLVELELERAGDLRDFVKLLDNWFAASTRPLRAIAAPFNLTQPNLT